MLHPGLRVLVYSGSNDAYVPTEGTRAWVEALNLTAGGAGATAAGVEAAKYPGSGPAAAAFRTWVDASTGQVGGCQHSPARLQTGLQPGCCALPGSGTVLASWDV